MATADEIVVKLTAQTDQLNAGMAEASASVKANTDAMAASFNSATSSFAAFDAIEKMNLRTAEQVAEAQRTINEVQATGAFTAEELAAKQALVDAAMLNVGKSTKAASVALGGFASNSRTAYTASALISDALTGQFSRSRREIAALSNETGLMSRAFQFALSPAGLLAGAVGVLGIATIKAEEDLNDFDESVERTNGYMGTSAGELQAAAQKVESLGVSYTTAKEAVIDLANSGRFTGEQLLQAATAAAEFAQITGEKVSEVDRLMVEMATNPQKALDELVEKYHRVTPAQAEVIEQMIKEGDKAAATAALVQAMGTSVAESFDKQSQHAGMLDKMLRTLGRDFAEVGRGIGNSLNLATGGGDTAEKLTALQHQLADMRASGETTGGYAVAYQALQKQAAELQTIIDKQHQSAAAAKQMADAYAAAHPAQGTFAAFQKEGFGGIDLTGNLTKQLSDLEAAQKVSYAERENFESEYWSTVLQKAHAGTAAYIQAWSEVQSTQKRIDSEQLQESNEAQRKQEEAARRGAQAAKDRARAEQQASQEIVQEVQQEAAAKLALDLQDAENAHNIALAKIKTVLEGDKLQLANGKITAAQMAQDEIDALNKQLAADIELYQAKAKLAAGNAAEQAKWNAAITLDEQTTAAKIEAIEADLAKKIKRLDDDTAKNKERDDQQMIMSGFREVNALIGHQETLRQAMLNIGMQILEQQEQDVAKGIAEAMSGEQGKTAAAEAGAAERLGITIAGEAQALMVQGEAAVKWIMTEAAKAAAGAFNAMVSIPYVGPFLAVGASIAAFAAVSKLVSSVASAEGGWERVPADGVQTILHKDEMVLPKYVADPVRQMAKSGSGGGDTFKVYAQDARGLSDFIRRNGGTLSSSLRRLGRNGYR